ncbi:NAD(P)-dependent glycerol-3-phosphate dehydrogenase [Candidatus Dependentiae bacterium]|nr:NAD(P)-dependent glycerol-3-phosphate dehydrogenase [Candidatus Dependentiae bacterium]
MKKIGIIGAGSWGTAISIVLFNNGHSVTLWDKYSDNLDAIRLNNENRKFLPGIKIPEEILLEYDFNSLVESNEIIVFAIPAQFIRTVIVSIPPVKFEKKIIVNLAKGIETFSLKLLSEIFAEIFGKDILSRFCVLTGPSHAEEVSKLKPTSIIAASKKNETAELIQSVFSNKFFRVYTNSDLTGAEIGGAVKNIIAIAAGVCDGLKLGDNARAALITRGLAEITRFGVKLGADERTFSGLSGLGDLVVTCGSIHSRNYKCGLLLAENYDIDRIKTEINQIIEGIDTVKSAYRLSKKFDIDMPITEQVYNLICGNISAETAVKQLMERMAKPEFV